MSWQEEIEVIEINSQKQAAALMQKMGVDRGGLEVMAPKAVHYAVKLKNVPAAAANILKQEMLARGGEAAVRRGVIDGAVDSSDVLLLGTARQLQLLLEKLRRQPFGLRQLREPLEKALRNWEERPVWEIPCLRGKLTFGERTLIMGILNVTPDSFSDGGLFNDPIRAVERAHEMVAEGADIIDVGGESTRPVYVPAENRGNNTVRKNIYGLPVEEEWRRLEPVLRRLVDEIRVPISVDTYHAETARRALEMGVDIINDVWGFKADPEMAGVCAAYDVPVILMHNQYSTNYRDLMFDILSGLRESIALAERAGVKSEKIIVDPGIGFGKDTEQNLEVMRSLRELKVLGKPVLLGTSRKSLIGNTLGLPVDQRMEGTAATVALGIALGVDIVRVHDVKEMVRVARMADAVVRR
ncbi:MAG: dihydropteroate synthase [Clostridia bacterium]|nr:dihydropteroate synthase [Clostridia bacterium]